MHMRAVILLLSTFGIAAVAKAATTEPHIPLVGQAVSCERIKPVFQSRAIAKERGDVLLKLLDGGHAVEAIKRPGGIAPKVAPPRLWISVTLVDGTAYQIATDGGRIHLPEGIFEINEATQPQVRQWAADLDADLRREVLSAPRPCSYPVGIVRGTDTLSGIARLFYDDASKWTVIYEANKTILKNPNLVPAGAVLTIP